MTNKRPNVVLITLDECKSSALGCYGNKDAYSPNIDALAEEGILFSESYTTFPKCVPARTALVTGRYPHVDGHRTLPGFEIRKGENNIVLELKKNGYRTGMFGKNHTIERDILDEVFDECHKERVGQDVPWGKRHFENNDDLFRAFYRGDFSVLDEMADTIATRESIGFIEKNKQEPFFLLINYNAPHPPYTDIQPYIDIIRERKIKLPKVESLDNAPEILKTYRKVYDLDMLGEEDWRKVVEAYYGLVSYVDAQVALVLKKLEEEGLKENTVVILTSDHGDFAGEHGCVEKWDTIFYDCLIKVPLIIRCPGKTDKGRITDVMVENIDIAPTILELCGIEVPSWIQGKSLVQVLNGQPDNHKEAIFCEGGVEEAALVKSVHYDSEEHSKRHPNYYWKQKLMVDYPWTLYRAKMIRTKKWKLVYRVNGIKELYDMENDPAEFYDVSARPENREIIHKLMEQLLNWTIRTETDYPQVVKMYS